nr:morn repeat domain [Pandoravirus belohorizontensis]
MSAPLRAIERDRPVGHGPGGREQTGAALSDGEDCLLLALPDELVLAILAVHHDPEVPARAAPVSRRLGALSRDDVLWHRLYVHRYGPPVHKHWAEFGKNWRWLYEARSRRRNPGSAGPACAAVSPGGYFYCGQLNADGRRHGYGLLVYAEHLVKASDVDPRDVFALPEGSIEWRAEGEWTHGKRHGRVTEVVAGGRYDGAYVNGAREGHGTFAWRSGSVYRGMYAANQRSGWGVLDYADGRHYEGHWLCGVRRGEGKMALPDGRSYVGRWRNGKPDGWGACTWPNGNRVEATWQDGALQGEGALIAPDGRVVFDDAQQLFCVGFCVLPPKGPLDSSADDWGGRLKRMHDVPCGTDDGDVHHRTAHALYLDGSRLLVFWHRDDHARSCRIIGHAPSCSAVGHSITEAQQEDGVAVGTCMACLSAAHTREHRKPCWYRAATT